MNLLKPRIIAAALVIGVLVSAGALPASTKIAAAHVLEKDGNISAVLHIPPDDAPIAARPTIINVAFATSLAAFNVANYKIEISVKQGNRSLQTVPMQPLDGSSSNTTATITMPQAGGYQLAITGRPLTAGQDFTFSFPVRAGGEAGAVTAANRAGAGFDFWVISVGSWLLLVMVTVSAVRRGGRYRQTAGRSRKPR